MMFGGVVNGRPELSPEPEMEMLPGAEINIDVQAIPGRSDVLSGAKTTARVVFRIITPEVEASAPKRAPIHVACVLDSSGSMAGQSLDYAKRAVKKLVKHLSQGDTLHLITYSSAARLVFRDGDLSEEGKENMKDMVDSIDAGGQTNLMGGLELAVQVLAGREATSITSSKVVEPFGDGVVRRIFLFSDGCVNVGVVDPQQIRHQVAQWAESGITTTSFGIGINFDESLMRGIAEAGQGRYKFLATAPDIPKMVSKAVHDLLDLYASEVTLDLRGGEFTTVSRVYGSGQDEEEGGSCDAPGLLHLGDVHNANERMVLAELDVAPAGNTADGTVFTAAEWTITGQRNGTPMQLSGEIKLQATRDRSRLGNEASIVHTAFAIRRAGDMDLEVADLLARGDRQRAREAKSRQLALLRLAFEAAQQDGSDTQMLSKIIERAQLVADQLDNEREDVEMLRRQCVQECELNCAMSCASFDDRLDSSCGASSAHGGDVANLRDFLDFNDSPQLSPRSQSSTISDSGSGIGGVAFNSSIPTPKRSRQSGVKGFISRLCQPKARPTQSRQSGVKGLISRLCQPKAR